MIGFWSSAIHSTPLARYFDSTSLGEACPFDQRIQLQLLPCVSAKRLSIIVILSLMNRGEVLAFVSFKAYLLLHSTGYPLDYAFISRMI